LKKREIKRALVTGASGFIGTHLVRALHAQGIHVVATDRYEPIAPLPVENFFVEDLVDGTQWPDSMDRVDTVFHLAAIPSIARLDEGEYQRVNVEGSMRVARLASRHDVQKILHMSSSTVYGIPKKYPLPEDAPIQPKNPYSRSKAEAENAFIEYSKAVVPTTIIRPRVVVGAGRAGIFGLLFASMKSNLPIPMFGGGENRFQFTAVEDLVTASILAAREETDGRHQTYNIGCDVERTLRGEVQGLIDASGSSSRILSIPSKPFEMSMAGLYKLGISPLVPEQYQIASANFVLDTAKAKRNLGFQPKHANGDGLIEAWEWWSKRNKTESGLRGIVRSWKPKYQNALQKRER